MSYGDALQERNVKFRAPDPASVNGAKSTAARPCRWSDRRYPKLYSQDLLNYLFRHPYTEIEFVERDLGISRVTATKYLDQAGDAGLVLKVKRGRTSFDINEPFIKLPSF